MAITAPLEGEEVDAGLEDDDDDALQDILDSASFELDMDAIVLGKDE